MGFTGFPAEAFAFLDGLTADNSRTYWQANKHVYDLALREPMVALLDELADFGPFHVFRPNRDVRFAADKRPYKEQIGAFGESQGGAGYYVHVSRTGLLAGSGYYDMATDQLARFREAVDDEVLGPQIAALAGALVRSGLHVGAMSELKTAPRGYPRDHPRIDLLRRKGLMASREWKPAAWLHTKAASGKVREAWAAGAEMNEWLDTHVGPSRLAPDDGLSGCRR
ncbi:MAG: DUF2461 domain-containing protein [Ilumatobacteraceae bacterium]